MTDVASPRSHGRSRVVWVGLGVSTDGAASCSHHRAAEHGSSSVSEAQTPSSAEQICPLLCPR